MAIRVVDGADAFDREIITDTDMKIGFISGSGGECARVKIGVAGLRAFGMRITLNREDESGARSALGGEARFCALREIA